MSRKGVPNKFTKYDTHVLPRLSEIKDWIIEGYTNEEISEKLGINPDTWYRYLREKEVLSEFVALGRSVLNAKVENSLYRLCTGYEYEEIKTVVEEDKNGKKRTRIEKTKKYQPPSSQAISFWLRNRAPEQWNERKELILDTKQNEEERKKLFMEMIEEDAVEADYSEVEGQLLEAPEE